MQSIQHYPQAMPAMTEEQQEIIQSNMKEANKVAGEYASGIKEKNQKIDFLQLVMKTEESFYSDYPE